MSNKSGSSSQIISLPKGGGAQHGIGEKFSPDLHTGTGNFIIPIALPPGRNGFQPQLNLVYSTGNGNSSFGLGWNLSIPGVMRKTSEGIPQYDDNKDTFILSGAEDLVPIEQNPGAVRYKPRTEGLFAEIIHHLDASNNYWAVRSKDGLVSRYGTQGVAGRDPAAIANPTDRSQIFAWKLTQTTDPFGNRIEYEYDRDLGEDGPHHWDQLYLKQVRYADYTDQQGETKYLVSVEFKYEDRTDAFSEYRAGFEIRTRRRCRQIIVKTHAQTERLVRTYQLTYTNDRHNSVSLLSQIEVVGHDGDRSEALPPLKFSYTQFEPEGRDFFPIAGPDLPPGSLARPEYELADLFGNGLPDILEMNGTVRYWRNLGNGRFDRPREMRDAPAGLQLADPGVQLIDADGDGRIDLLVTTGAMSGYFPLRFGGLWDRRSFQRYQFAPSFNLEDPEVKLVDLNGDGVTDAIRSGSRLECFFNDPKKGWKETRWVERRALENFPNINFSDPRVKWGDMTGDGLQDIVLVYDGNIEYWPNLGYGNWGERISMSNSPRFRYGYDPKRILVGDVDGDGLADIVYVDDTKVILWINQSGNGWSDPIEIKGTPPVSDTDAIRLVDLLGSGISGVLWSADANGLSRQHMFFLDFTGGVKPYLLNEMDNHMGSLTRVGYAPSIQFYLEDEKRLETRWKTPLPFPVQVVAKVEVVDHFSRGKMTTEYHYHHGYWDGAEREFRGFGRVEQRDTEVFEEFNAEGLHGDRPFERVSAKTFSPPLETRTWFHQGPVGDEFGEWEELDFSNEFWAGDKQVLSRPSQTTNFLKGLPRRVKRDALRALRGTILRTELYALDGTEQQNRPYTVTESIQGVREESPPGSSETDRKHIFFTFTLGQRTTQWERGEEPMSQFAFTDDYDDYGQPQRQTQIACPRSWRSLNDSPSETYLATRSRTVYASPVNPQVYIRDRVATTTTYEIGNTIRQRVLDLAILPDDSPTLKVISQKLNFYDGSEFQGLGFRLIGDYGALVRSESLVLTQEILHDGYRSGNTVLTPAEEPLYLTPGGAIAWTTEYPQDFRRQLPTLAGYIYQVGGAGSEYTTGYFAVTERRSYDFHQAGEKRGLVRVMRDPLGHDTTVTYDTPYHLLPSKVTDSVGLSTEAEYDYRVLQPKQVKDPNGNLSVFTFTPLGLLSTTLVKGKAGEGDRNRPSVRMEYSFLAFLNSPPEQRQPIFVRTIRHTHHDTETDIPQAERDETIESIEYSDGFGRLLQIRTQAEDVLFGNSVFGGEILPADQNDEAGTRQEVSGRENSDRTNLNVVVSGWQTYDNKGRVVEKYEPFFSTGWAYRSPQDEQDRFNRQVLGQKVTMHYDPRGQAIRTVNPDNSEQRVIYGIPADLNNPEQFTPTPWEAYTYDANDNAGRTHSTDVKAKQYEHHWNTPTSIKIDALGRTVETVERNRAKPSAPGNPLPPIEEYRTQSTYDIRGNLLIVMDALGRKAFQHVYDLTNRKLRIDSIDAGIWRIVLDAMGNAIEQRDSKGALTLHAYDLLNRPTHLWARDGVGQAMTLRQRLIYGDSPDSGLTRAQAEAGNLLGKLYKHYDDVGLLTIEAYDFKGNILEKVRQVIRDDQILSVFASAAANNWQVQAYRVDWQPNGTTLENHARSILDATNYQTSASYDALNRVKVIRYPQDVENQRRSLHPTYNRAGALERVELEFLKPNGTTQRDLYVERIAYNAKGQRVLIAYGNGIMTRHAYDPKTFRLVRMRSQRYEQLNPVSYRPTGAPLQDFAYDYDLVGNITAIRDRTPGGGVASNVPLGANALDRAFTYDPLYRLLYATGRECKDIPQPRPWTDEPRCGFNSGNHGTPNQDNAPNLTSLYREEYDYDAAGNLMVLRHQQAIQSGGGSAWETTWSRHFGMGGLTPEQWNQEWRQHLTGEWLNPPGNRLTHVEDRRAGVPSLPAVPQTHFYDDNGNLIRENNSRRFEWDYADRMRVYRTQAGNSEPSVYAYYLYDASGQRVKKLVRRGANEYEVTIYIDGVFEYHRLVKPGETRENNTLHVMDNQSRVALIRVGDAFPGEGVPSVKVKYHLGDHLGSSNLVIDDAGGWINREEYTPYGETSFGSFARKRYRFTGKERDEESGLYYHGARYYAPWIGRWVSCDPAGMVDGTNVYAYVRNNPCSLVDLKGTDSKGTDSKNVHLPKVSPSSAIPIGKNSAGETEYVLGDNSNQAQDRESKKDETTEVVNVTVHGVRPVRNQEQGQESGESEERSFWSRGGAGLVLGGIATGIGAAIIFSNPIGWGIGLAGAMLFAGGIASTIVSALGLGASYSGATTKKQDAVTNKAADIVLSLSSPGGLVGGTTGLVIGGEEGLERGALIGGLYEGAVSVGTAIARLRPGPGLSLEPIAEASLEEWRKMSTAQRTIYEKGQLALRDQPYRALEALSPMQRGRELIRRGILRNINPFNLPKLLKTGGTPGARFVGPSLFDAAQHVLFDPVIHVDLQIQDLEIQKK
ncbi:hypothetical protein B7486_44570 [cyanobacterium TDX16]|nr:hypothetical protein B7486_44570 [cyanobacterium TDX16]